MTVSTIVRRHRALAALAGIALTATAVVAPAAVASAGPKAPVPVAVQALNVAAPAAVPVPGTWSLAFSWGCSGSYSTIPVVLNANGTWSGAGFTGLWTSLEGQFVLTFDNSETTYSGAITGRSVTGINTTFAGLSGCFYMLQAGALTASTVGSDGHNAAGGK
jgi:hypothetical protein